MCVCVLVCTCMCRFTCIFVRSCMEARCQCHLSSSFIHQLVFFFFFEAGCLTEPDVLEKKPTNPRDIPVSVLQYYNYRKLQPCPAFHVSPGDGTQTLMFSRESHRSLSFCDKHFTESHISSAPIFIILSIQ